MPTEPHVPIALPSSAALGRRTVLRAVTAASGLTVTAAAAVTAASSVSAAPATRAAPGTALGGHQTELVLLGTSGGPVPMNGRSGIASALLVDGHAYVVDCGPGAFGQCAKAGLAADQLTAVFVTHLHSDHLADLYALLWLRFGGYQPFTHAVDIYGPGSAGALPAVWPAERRVATVSPSAPAPGISDLLDRQIAGTAYDINVRMRSEGWPDIRPLVRPHDIPLPRTTASPTGAMAPAMEPFEVMRDDRVRVTAVLVDHPPVFPSYAYRFDTADGSVVFSGDTAPTPNLETLARGADILVHEAIDLGILALGGLSPAQLRHMEISHTDVTRLGRIADRTGCGTLVLSHLVPGGTDLVPDATWQSKAGRGHGGRVVVGHDLMRLPLGAVRGRI